MAMRDVWKVTDAEYRQALELSKHQNPAIAKPAYQLVRFCREQIFYRDQAAHALQMIRSECEPLRPVDDGSCDPLYGQRMDSADMGEN
jgi:hypothetical protein